MGVGVGPRRVETGARRSSPAAPVREDRTTSIRCHHRRPSEAREESRHTRVDPPVDRRGASGKVHGRAVLLRTDNGKNGPVHPRQSVDSEIGHLPQRPPSSPFPTENPIAFRVLRLPAAAGMVPRQHDRRARCPARRHPVHRRLAPRPPGAGARAPAPTRCPSSPGPTPPPPASHRPTPLGLALSGVVREAARGAHRLARHRRALAPARVRPGLALKATTPRFLGGRPSLCRPPPPCPPDARGQPAVGRAPHSRRAPEAGDRTLPGDRGEVPSPPSSNAPAPDLEHLPHQPRDSARVHRLLHRPDRDRPRALRVRGSVP